MISRHQNPRQIQERKIRWEHGLTRRQAALIADLHYGGSCND